MAGPPTTHGLSALAEAAAAGRRAARRQLKAAGAIPIARTNLPDFALRWHTDSGCTERRAIRGTLPEPGRLQRRRGRGAGHGDDPTRGWATTTAAPCASHRNSAAPPPSSPRPAAWPGPRCWSPATSRSRYSSTPCRGRWPAAWRTCASLWRRSAARSRATPGTVPAPLRGPEGAEARGDDRGAAQAGRGPGRGGGRAPRGRRAARRRRHGGRSRAAGGGDGGGSVGAANRGRGRHRFAADDGARGERGRRALPAHDPRPGPVAGVQRATSRARRRATPSAAAGPSSRRSGRWCSARCDTMQPFPVGFDLEGPESVGRVDARRCAWDSPANLFGLPSAAVPVGVAQGLPQGVQVIGPALPARTCAWTRRKRSRSAWAPSPRSTRKTERPTAPGGRMARAPRRPPRPI